MQCTYIDFTFLSLTSNAADLKQFLACSYTWKAAYKEHVQAHFHQTARLERLLQAAVSPKEDETHSSSAILAMLLEMYVLIYTQYTCSKDKSVAKKIFFIVDREPAKWTSQVCL